VLESRWVRWVGPGVVALGVLGSLATATLGAAQSPRRPPTCGTAGDGPAAAAVATPVALDELRLEPWYRIDPTLDREGALQGQRLAVGIDGDRSSRSLDLPAESFAAGPFGRLVLVGSDDGSTSRLDAIDVASACSFAITEESAVVRRATIDAAGETLYEMLVDRSTRADLGIWARPVDGSGPAVQILEAIRPDDRFGRTFSTELSWDVSGEQLVVESCGEAACRVRIVGPAGGSSQTIDEPDIGTVLGLDDFQLVAYLACPGMPCPIVSIDTRTRGRRVLVEAAAAAMVISTPDGPRLAHEVIDPAGLALRSVALDGSAASDLGRLDDGLRLQALPALAEAATRLPSGWVLVTPGGRLLPSGPSTETQLRHVPDGASVQLEEYSR